MRDRTQTAAEQERASGPITPRRKAAVWALIVLATVVLLIGALTIWVKREVLDTGNFTASTTELMRNPKVQSALATFLVDQIYENVDVHANLERQLPNNLKGFAGPAAAAWCPRTATAPVTGWWACESGSRSTAANSRRRREPAAASRSVPACRSARKPNRDPRPARRRPGAGPRRLPDDPRRPGGHRGRGGGG